MKNNYDLFKAIRKPIAPPTKVFGWKKEENDKDMIEDGLEEYFSEKDSE